MLPEEGLRLVREYGSADRWLAVLVTLRPDGQPSVSVVNAGALPHPVDGAPGRRVRGPGQHSQAREPAPRSPRHPGVPGRVSGSPCTGPLSCGPWPTAARGSARAGLPNLLRDIYRAAGAATPTWPSTTG